MRITMRRAVLAGVGLLVGTAISACSSGTSTQGGGADGTFTVALPSDITNFDPATNQLIEYIYAIRNTVFSGLVKYDDKLGVVPDLATPTANKDATQYTFALRSGAKFQDNTPVTAAAVIQSLKRVAAGKSVYSSYLADVASYSAPNPTTVVLKLKKSNAALLDGLVNIAILAPSHAGDVSKHPVGSGPFSFVSAVANRQIVLQRFDGYYGAKPKVTKLVYDITTDPQVAVNNLYSGAVDAVSEASTAVVKQLNKGKAAVVSPGSSNSIVMYEFNSSGKLSNPKVRQALAMALDRKTVQTAVYNGQGAVTGSVVPSGPFAVGSLPGYDYDPSQAKSLLASAGASGLSVNLIIPSGYPEADQTARIWQTGLAKAGVKLNIRTQESSVWVQNYVKHNYDVTWNFFNESGDPNSFFNTIMLPHLQADYRNPAMEQAMARALTVTDHKTRVGDYAALASQVNHDLPVLVVQTRPLAAVVRSNVAGLTVNPLGWLDFGHVMSS